jgi:murein DD-endopeptidase MepM/ murein hydrolase activator NlpD
VILRGVLTKLQIFPNFALRFHGGGRGIHTTKSTGSMGKLKLYYYSEETLGFIPAKGAKLRISSIAIGIVLSVLMLSFFVNEYLDDPAGLGVKRSSFLYSENAMLKQQLQTVLVKLERLENELLALNQRGNELRLLVDLPKIDEDTRKVGVGGTEEQRYYGGSLDVEEQLQRMHRLLSRAERELQLQHSSYREVSQRYEENQMRFAHLPAIKPMEGFLSSGFGIRWHPIFQVRRPHEGIDIVNEKGTPVYAAGDGVVEMAGRNLSGYGIMVMINHGYGYTTVYGHLSKYLVREGQRVKRGDLIGLCGDTGIATSPHLHYEVRLHGVQQNPIDYFFDDFNYVEALKNETTGSGQ